MRKKVICSVCSREKSGDKELLPARQRYTGSHIAKVAQRAQEEGLPFFILSGVHGLISAEEPIGHYDHLLVAEEVPALVQVITGQLKAEGVQEVCFYTKDKLNWAPYLEAFKKATEGACVPFSIMMMRDDD